MKLPLYFSHILQPLYHTHLTFFCMFCKIEKKINFIISIFFFVRFCKWFVLDHSVWFPAGFASLFTHQFDMFRVKCGYPLTCTQTHAQQKVHFDGSTCLRVWVIVDMHFSLCISYTDPGPWRKKNKKKSLVATYVSTREEDTLEVHRNINLIFIPPLNKLL